MGDNSDKIKQLEEDLAKAKREQVEYEGLSDEQKLAEFIHSKTCSGNHTDFCGWFYESWDKLGQNSTRGSYLKKARAILEEVDLKTAELVIKNM
jgi:hypothetical protein